MSDRRRGHGLRFAAASIALAMVANAAADRQPTDGFLEEYAATYHYSLGHPKAVQVTRQGDAVLFLRSGPRDFVQDLFEVDLATGTERLLASAGQLLGKRGEDLPPEELARRERMRLAARGIATYQLSRDGKKVLVPLSGALFLVDRERGQSRELPSDAGYPIDARLSPDGSQVASVRGGELHVLNVASGEERQLTFGATETLTHGLAEFVAQEEMQRMQGYWWSPDSRRILFQETDTANVEQWTIADPSHPGQAPTTSRYPRPGKANAEVRLGIIDCAGGEPKWIQWNRKQFPYLADVSWTSNAPLTIVVQNREQTELLLLSVDPEDGTTRQLLKESDATWINLDGDMPCWLRDGKSFLWATERSGWWQLEIRHADGRLQDKLTTPEFNYRSLAGVDADAGEAVVVGGADPTQQHLYRVALDGQSPPRQKTTTPGVHWAVVAEHGGTYVAGSRLMNGSRSVAAYRADGTRIAKLQSNAAAPPFVPNIELVEIGADPHFHAAIVRPRDFDAHSKHTYPVIVSVYGGPHAQTVTTDARRYLLNQWIADQGFIVVSIDGRGTPSRGRDWERAIKGNLIEVPLEDQVCGLRALGQEYGEMDLGHVGIYGWSFGGYFSAMAVMQRPEVFHVGVAGAPVVDWHDYDTHYTERYMGLPSQNQKGYQAASVLSHVASLRRPLLVIHGTSDDNVFFLHSARLVDALFRHGKRFDFLPLTGYTHMVADPLVTRRLYERIVNYFQAHLSREAGGQER